ncbi:Cof-type HAD-IIB family hydrolase [Spiroplasma taiwanense]|uniref:HAD superfamily hydrolase n=1 Tax=Spiroplasma taiwanense CT-1 TaxID=1276220 RepID=S5LYT1_9MOLU|nr:Cof-type HAD-IIB family hydrolase [Spiroplasma taiwanense]AGR40842.1 HAD superfamily hydrolase [Spiroplasma taiwanense CT-1]
MKLKKNVLIFCDLDGTALASDHTFSQITKEVVKKVYGKNYYFIPVTARSTKDAIDFQSIHLELDKLGGIASGNNGSHIYDFKNKTWIERAYVSEENIKKIFNLTYGQIGKYKVHFFSDQTCFVYGEGENSKYWSEIMQMDYKIIEKLSDINEKINHLVVILEKNPSEQIQNNFLEKFKIISNELDIIKYTDRVYELAVKGINKGSVIRKVQQYLNLDNSNTSVFCFGDSFNDIEMFKEAEFPVAMENAIDELKQIAKFITLSNDNDGVAKFIEKNILKEEKE